MEALRRSRVRHHPARSPRPVLRPVAPVLALLVAVVAAVGGPVPGAGGASLPGPGMPGQARPTTTVSPDGLSATDGQRTLQVAQARDLAPGGQPVAVSGSGYDEHKGIYVALCLVTPPDVAPSPCGGGIDIDGVSGASAWISSNPPSYGTDLAQPYGPGGTFSVVVTVSPVLSGGYDCRQVQCAIVTRSDHVRTADRSQDVLVPVRFAAGDAPPPETPPGSTPSTLAPPPPPSTAPVPAAPETVLSADGRTGTAGGRSLTVSAVDGLDPAGATVTVTGEGFEEAKGVLVSLCRVATSPTEAPAPCLAGASPGASRWVSSSPPDYAADLVVPYEDGGRFEVTLDVAAEIDDETDCREVDCAVVVRRDDLDAGDRTLDIAVPVRFGDGDDEGEGPGAAPPATEADATPAPPVPAGDGADDPGSGSVLPWILLVLVGVALAGGLSVVLVRRRMGAGASEAGPSRTSSGAGSPGPGASGPGAGVTPSEGSA